MECAHALFFIVYVFSLIPSTIRPLKQTVTFHLVIFPFTFVLTTVRPVVNTYEILFNNTYQLTLAFDIVLDKITGVSALVCPCEAALSIFAAFYIVTFVTCTIWPGLKTLSMLLVLLPISLVTCTI